MATNEPNKQDNKENAPDQPLQAGGEVTPLEMTAEETAALAGEGEKALHDIGEEQLEPPAPFDMGGEHIPDPGDVVVPFDKINEILSEKQAAAHEAEKTAEPDKEPTTPEAPAAEEQAPVKKGRGGRPSKADKTTEPPDKAASAAESQQKKRGGRPPKADKPDKTPEKEKPKKPDRQPKAPKEEKAASAKEDAPPAPAEPEQPPAPPRDATRNGETEQIVYLNLAELHAFKNHPFGVRDDSEMKALVESVKNGGVNQPALVRPREDGGYEIVAGHRRQKASELAGYANMPCIVREMTDDEAIIAMTDDNLRQRSEILPSEKAVSLKMQLEAISHQGARDTSGQFRGVYKAPKIQENKRENSVTAKK